MIQRRLLMGGGGSFVVNRTMPTDWGITREATNPIITVTGGEPNEMYVPAAVEVAGYRWVYVKGASRIYAWRSGASGALPYTIQNAGASVLEPVAATWMGSFVAEPVALADDATSLIHVWFGARDANPDNWAIGHATAPYSDPTDFTLDGANPILTAATVEAALGHGNITDVKLGDVVYINGAFHFYGYSLDTTYRLWQATGTDFNDPTGVEEILATSGGDTVVQTPAVVEVPGMGLPLYAMFYSHGGGQPDPRWIRVASSPDGETWDFSDTTDIISPTGTGWEEDETYSGHFLKENVSPWTMPLFDSLGRLLFYYSGLENSVAQSGLIYMEPTY